MRTLGLFSGFPREIGVNRKVVRNSRQFLSFLNLHNGKQSLYSTIFAFSKLKTPWRCDYESAIIDKFFADLDGEESYENVMKLHDTFMKEKIYHRIQLTGGGYQFFGYGRVVDLKNKKDTLFNLSDHYENKCKIILDRKCRGDIARICRITGTFNIKRRKWAIGCTKKMLEEGDAAIRKMADKQQKIKLSEWLLGGPNFINFKPFDGERKIDMNMPDGLDYDKKIPDHVSIAIKCPGLQILTTNKNLGYDGRYLIILYLKESGMTPGETVSFLKSFLSKKKLYHCIQEEKAVQYIFRRHNLLMPNRETMKDKGVCVFNCEKCCLEELYFNE
jgi:hypothetical protein